MASVTGGGAQPIDWGQRAQELDGYVKNLGKKGGDVGADSKQAIHGVVSEVFNSLAGVQDPQGKVKLDPSRVKILQAAHAVQARLPQGASEEDRDRLSNTYLRILLRCAP